MPNEFYCVEFADDERFFFKDKDKAFAFAWQMFLNTEAGLITDAELRNAREELYSAYFISGYVYIHVCGFED